MVVRVICEDFTALSDVYTSTAERLAMLYFPAIDRQINRDCLLAISPWK